MRFSLYSRVYPFIYIANRFRFFFVPLSSMRIDHFNDKYFFPFFLCETLFIPLLSYHVFVQNVIRFFCKKRNLKYQVQLNHKFTCHPFLLAEESGQFWIYTKKLCRTTVSADFVHGSSFSEYSSLHFHLRRRNSSGTLWIAVIPLTVFHGRHSDQRIPFQPVRTK